MQFSQTCYYDGELQQIYYRNRMDDSPTQLHQELAAPLTQSKISWLSIGNGLQNALTAAILGGAIPPIPGVPLIIQPIIGIVLSAAVLYVRKQIQKRAQNLLPVTQG